MGRPPNEHAPNREREKAIAAFNGGTPELGFVPQFVFSERLLLRARARLVQLLRSVDLLPDVKTKNIQLWASPRCMSTSLLHAFEQRSDTRVFDEVIYSAYLSATEERVAAKHPGHKEVMGALEPDKECLVNDLILGPHTAPVVFFKQMTHHLFGAGFDRSFLRQTTNILLTRPPRDMVASFARDFNGKPVTMEDVGYEQQGLLFDELLQATGHEPIVIDSQLFLARPEKVLRELCERLDLEFQPSMLNWPRGASAFDGVWGKHWYKGVVASSSFGEYRGHDIPDNRPDLETLAKRCEEHYAPLLAVALGR